MATKSYFFMTKVGGMDRIPTLDQLRTEILRLRDSYPYIAGTEVKIIEFTHHGDCRVSRGQRTMVIPAA